MKTLNVRGLSLMICVAIFTALIVYPLGMHKAYAEDHNPRIRHAIAALHDAEDEINNAGHDFHGQKRDAVEAIHNAIDHLDRIKDW